MDLWHPDALRVIPASYVGSSMTRWEKQVIHTIEAKVYRPSSASYYGHQLWPTSTVAPDSTGAWRIFQHLPLSRSAAAMRNVAGGVETNRDGCVQVEVAWVAAEGPALPDEACAVLRSWLWWVHEQTGIPWTWLEFHDYPPEDGYRLGREPWRLRGAAWDDYRGALGHQHADENVHGDPGRIPADRIFGATPAPPTPPEEPVRATYVRKPNTTQVYVAGIGMAEPRPVTLFRDAEYHCAREGIVLVDPPVDARDPIGDGQGDVRWVMRMDDASLMGIPRPATAVDVDALAESLAPLLDDVDGAPSAAEVAAAVSVALAPEFDAIPMEVVDEAAARLAGLD